MNLLAIETSTPQCSAALLTEHAIIERVHAQARQHTQVLLPMIDALLTEADLALADIDIIAYGAGPGAFTGLRVGISVAQGLGFGADIKLCGVSSLAIVAAEVLHSAPEQRVCVAQDARMGEIYTGRFCMDQGMATSIGAERVCAPSADVMDPTDLLAGDAWLRIADMQALASGSAPEVLAPRAKFALGFAKMHALAGTGVAAGDARLNYLRDNVTG